MIKEQFLFPFRKACLSYTLACVCLFIVAHVTCIACPLWLSFSICCLNLPHITSGPLPYPCHSLVFQLCLFSIVFIFCFGSNLVLCFCSQLHSWLLPFKHSILLHSHYDSYYKKQLPKKPEGNKGW